MAFRIALVSVVAVVLFAESAAKAQMASEYEHITFTKFGEATTQVFFETDATFQEDVKDQDASYQMTTYDFRLRFPVYQDERNMLTIQPAVRFWDMETRAKLPGSGETIPNGLWDVGLTGTYKRKLDNDWVVGGWLTLSSPSDRPFHTLDEVRVLLNLVLNVPAADERDSWVFLLNYTNTRDFANNVPLPGVGYSFRRGETWSGLLGAPILFLRYKPIDELTLQARWLMPRNITARAGYELFEGVELYGLYTWQGNSFLRYGRDDDDDMLVFYEMRASAGVQWRINERTTLDVSGGYAFDRFWYEADEFEDRSDSIFHISDGPVAQVNLSVEL